MKNQNISHSNSQNFGNTWRHFLSLWTHTKTPFPTHDVEKPKKTFMVKSSRAAREQLVLNSLVNKLCSLGSSSMISKMSKLELARARYMVLVTHHYLAPTNKGCRLRFFFRNLQKNVSNICISSNYLVIVAVVSSCIKQVIL